MFYNLNQAKIVFISPAKHFSKHAPRSKAKQCLAVQIKITTSYHGTTQLPPVSFFSTLTKKWGRAGDPRTLTTMRTLSLEAVQPLTRA